VYIVVWNSNQSKSEPGKKLIKERILNTAEKRERSKGMGEQKGGRQAGSNDGEKERKEESTGTELRKE
jgi:hypothetical protein